MATWSRTKPRADGFRNDQEMTDEPPDCSEADFKEPKLRKCLLDPQTISWQNAKLLGGGVDGCVWRVFFGSRGPYVLKVVSSSIPTIHRTWQLCNSLLLPYLF